MTATIKYWEVRECESEFNVTKEEMDAIRAGKIPEWIRKKIAIQICNEYDLPVSDYKLLE